MESSSAEKNTRVSAPRKRATRRRVSEDTGRATAPRRTTRQSDTKRSTTPAIAEKPAPRVTTKSEPDTGRKAPTSLAGKRAEKKKRKKRLLVVGLVLVIGIGTSVVVGHTDQGWIDVKETIEARNDRIKNNQADESDLLRSQVAVPVQDTTNSQNPSEGLVGVGKVKATKPPVKTASSTASTSDQTASSTAALASSTEAVAEDSDSETEADDTSVSSTEDSL